MKIRLRNGDVLALWVLSLLAQNHYFTSSSWSLVGFAIALFLWCWSQ